MEIFADSQKVERQQETSGVDLCRSDEHCARPPNLDEQRLVLQGEQGSHKCSTYYEVFRDGSTLEQHLRVHNGERPYKCKTGGKGFTHKGHLNSHVLLHVGERLIRGFSVSFWLIFDSLILAFPGQGLLFGKGSCVSIYIHASALFSFCN